MNCSCDKPFLSDETMNINGVRKVGLADRDYMKPDYNTKVKLDYNKNSPYHQPTRNKFSTGGGLGWWIVGLLVVVVIGTKIMGIW